MRVRIDSGSTSDDGPDGHATARLTGEFADWLAQDRSVGPHTEIRRIRPQRIDGAMSGDLVEWISLAVSSGFSATALVYAHRSFRASLPPRLRAGARMVVERGDLRVVVENGTEQDLARVAQVIAAAGQSLAISPPSPSATGGTPPQGPE
ncbi:hypothetical protein AS594_35280 [Streptomyces agglomeratus]|uniref:Uncharacterized protein n=1 Tax=Streptomyces agglomeratus TaxID=285458 RepID=A0A1E5PHC4_9ACTN|nr:hypothetical protein [Streptomyces agglomeratus]OEJ28906.1 hypothetical protein AS594_35280 [Streptomyces agglomeratus]